MNIVQPPPSITPDVLSRFAAIVGGKYAVTDAHDMAPYLVEAGKVWSA